MVQSKFALWVMYVVQAYLVRFGELVSTKLRTMILLWPSDLALYLVTLVRCRPHVPVQVARKASAERGARSFLCKHSPRMNLQN